MRKLNQVFTALLVAACFMFVTACNDEDDTPEIFGAPTITVLADNSEPFPGDEVNFTISVNAPGGLASVSFEGEEIQTYTSDQTSDEFTYNYVIPEDEGFGNQSFDFEVRDAQAEVRQATTNVSLAVRNPDDRGEPVVLASMSEPAPAGSLERVFSGADGDQSWERGFALTEGVDDPTGTDNSVLKARRQGASVWRFQGSGNFEFIFNSMLSEEDMLAVFEGERVIQVNVLFEEEPDNYGDDEEVYLFSQNAPADGIPVEFQLGSNDDWGFDPAVGNVGRKMYLTANLTAGAEWQTITFSVREDEDNPGQPFDYDPSIGFDQINRAMIVPNVGQASTPNDLNNYYFFNLRTIDAEEADNNPNF